MSAPVRSFLKGVAVFLGGIAGFVVFLLPLAIDGVEYAEPVAWGVFVSPFVGATVTGWLVSLRAERSSKIRWIVGGGLGLGLVAMLAIVVPMVWLLFQISSTIST